MPLESPSHSEAARVSKKSLEVDRHGRARLRGCSNIKDYEMLSKLGEGTFGEVHKARSRVNGSVVALKKILMHNEKDGFPITALREIKLLKMLSHVNILSLEEMAVERTKGEGRKKAIMYMVTPYMDHDLSGLLENPDVRFTEPQIKCYMLQLLEGLRYLHDNHILHRDMKAANLLISNKGILQIADFGLARHYDDPVPQAGKGNGEAKRDYTTVVVTRWYRPPELLLQMRKYTPAIDMWGVGCVFGEMFVGKPILAGNSDLNQAQIIFDLVGTPNEETMPGFGALPGCEGIKEFKPRSSTLAQRFRPQGPMVISLLNALLTLDWRKRINAIDALKHPYFTSEPLPARPADIPRFEDSHELDRRKFRGLKAGPPPAPAGGTVGMGTNGWAGGPGARSGPAGGWNHGGSGGSGGGGGRGNRVPAPLPSHAAPPPRAPRVSGGPGGAPARQPAWAGGERHDLRLPPRPPNSAWTAGAAGAGDKSADRGRDRGFARGEGGNSRVDTYIPNYGSGADGRRRDERHDRDRYGGGGGGERRERTERREDTRRRSRSPGRDRDRDRGLDHRERDVYRR
ncbi:MAG: serine/threonine protein kinase, CMGC, CDC2/CDK sub [Thelocarpon superellum]|nr:MAG: serine/threonine protein kinase, CMGC, CDC2/CDK sub [Thelocarpon superellum]